MSHPATGDPATIRDYLQLFRLPNVFTALGDVSMGFLFVHASLRPVPAYLLVAAASALLYTAGMVLNDVWDIEQDRRERPSRPIASGRIALPWARQLGFGLLASGVAFGWAAGYLPWGDAAMPWRSGLVATSLAFLIVLYDTLLKRTPLGPLAMGGCRLLNVLLGMSVASSVAARSIVLGFNTAQLLAAAGIGLYIVGVTWFARREAVMSSRGQLAAATIVMAGGIGLLGLVYRWLPVGVSKTLPQEPVWFMLLGLLAFTIVRRCAVAVADPSPVHVQLAVTSAIWSLIVLDAALVLLVCHPGWALAIVLLLIPTLFLGRWIEST